MSQQGIFSIAPDAQAGAQAANSNGNQINRGGNGSPFIAISNAPSQDSPFTQAQSPFQQVQSADVSGRNGANGGDSGIPQRRPEGQPPALGGGSVGADAAAPVEQTEETSLYAAASDNAGGPFQMNGFPANAGSRVMEAAPVSAASTASPFVAVANDHTNYEAAKAGLEPQQDFAAVQPHYTPVREQAQQAQSLQQAQSSQQAQPVQSYQAAPAAQQSQSAGPAQPSHPVYSSPPQQAPATQVFAAPFASAAEPAFEQLELRAIFGVDHVLDVSQILQRARTLPGIRNVSVVGQQEASALSNFRQAMQSMGFGDSNDMKLNSGGGSIDFLSERDTTLAVLLEGAYAPGVQETLIIVAREIGKLA